jgi:hypothetical protein
LLDAHFTFPRFTAEVEKSPDARERGFACHELSEPEVLLP